MSQIIHIKTAELAVGDRNRQITTNSIGSCVIVVLWDPVQKIGGLVHAMLPHRHEDLERVYPGKYVDEAIDNLLTAVIARGAKRENLHAKIIGGAAMFEKIDPAERVGPRNVKAARDKLRELNIFVEKEDTGGSSGRTVSFNIATGAVDIHSSI
jgi:chemotaxis protein CheD